MTAEITKEVIREMAISCVLDTMESEGIPLLKAVSILTDRGSDEWYEYIELTLEALELVEETNEIMLIKSAIEEHLAEVSGVGAI